MAAFELYKRQARAGTIRFRKMKTLAFLVLLLCAALFVGAVPTDEESDLDASVSFPKAGFH